MLSFAVCFKPVPYCVMIPQGMFHRRTIIIRGMVPYGGNRCVFVTVHVPTIYCMWLLTDTNTVSGFLWLQDEHQLCSEQIPGHRLPLEPQTEGGDFDEKQYDWRLLGPGGNRAQHEPLHRGPVLWSKYCQVLSYSLCTWSIQWNFMTLGAWFWLTVGQQCLKFCSQISIRTGRHKFKVFVNGQPLFDFHHRFHSFHEIDMLEIEGDVQLSYVHIWDHTPMHWSMNSVKYCLFVQVLDISEEFNQFKQDKKFPHHLLYCSYLVYWINKHVSNTFEMNEINIDHNKA